MLFVATFIATSGTPGERTARRLEWSPPEGINLIAEYWLLGGAVDVVVIMEADDVASIMAVFMPWADVFDISVSPAITGEEGMALSRQMMG